MSHLRGHELPLLGTEEVMSIQISNGTDDCIPGGLQTEDAQSVTEERVANPTKCFVQNNFGPAKEIPFEEGRPWAQPAPDPFLAAFQAHIREAEGFERQIGEIESPADQLLAETKGSLAPLEKSQIGVCFRAWKLVADGKVAASAIDEYALKAGIKAHRNERIPCSRLMRAIVKNGAIKGTPSSQRKRARASTYASAIDYAIRQGMSDEAFAAELDQHRKRSKHHGIEYLAAEGRKVRQTAKTERAADQVAEALNCLDEGGAFLAAGDFSGIEAGYRLLVINVPAETTNT
jgi:hypothetical protein